jgi:hypothetical protein
MKKAKDIEAKVYEIHRYIGRRVSQLDVLRGAERTELMTELAALGHIAAGLEWTLGQLGWNDIIVAYEESDTNGI